MNDESNRKRLGALLVVGILTVVVARTLFKQLVLGSGFAGITGFVTKFDVTIPGDAGAQSEDLTRMMILASSDVLAAVVLIGAIIVLLRLPRPTGKKPTLLLAAAAAVGLGAAFHCISHVFPGWLFDLGIADRLAVKIDLGANGYGTCTARSPWGYSVCTAVRISWAVGTVFLPIWVMAGLSLCLILYSDTTEQALANSTRTFNAMIYLASLLLIALVFRVGALIRWLAIFFGEHQQAVEKLASANTAVDGIFFSLLMVCLFAPVSVFLGWQAHAMAQGDDPAARRGWLADRGLISSPGEWMARFIAILGPALTGTLGQVYR